MSETELLTAQELAGRLRVRPSTIRRWARERRIPTVRLTPKVVRYELAAVVQAMHDDQRTRVQTLQQQAHRQGLSPTTAQEIEAAQQHTPRGQEVGHDA